MAKKRPSNEPSIYRIFMGDDYRGSGFVQLSIPGGGGRENRRCSVSAKDPGEALLWSDEIGALEARGFAVTKIGAASSANPTLTFEEAIEPAIEPGEAGGGE